MKISTVHFLTNRHLAIGVFVVGAILSCGSLPAAQGGSSPSSKLNSDDSTFLTNAAEGGQAEVDFANLALKKSQNPDVRAFATRMVTDHSKANTKLKAIAMEKGIKPPKGIGVANNAGMLKLKALSGDTFNKSYVDMMVDDHKKDVEDFEKESSNAGDDSLKKFATDTLPTLQEHYKMIQDLQAKMK